MKKSRSLRPPIPIVTLTNISDNAQFEVELCWCIQQMETALNSGRLSQKVSDDTAKSLKVLKGTSVPLIKKRQVMKAAMGDYRQKMKDEEKKMGLASKQIKFTPAEKTIKRSSFVKKSSLQTSGKDLEFNFDSAKLKESQSTERVKENFNGTQNLQLSPDSGFKFNFIVHEENNEINLKKLSIK